MRVRRRKWPQDAAADCSRVADEVEVWSAAYPPPGKFAGKFDDFLDREEWARSERLLPPDKRLQFRYRHGLLRVLLGRYLNRLPGELRLATAPNSKPFVDPSPCPQFDFSLSHTQAMDLFAFGTGGALGVDVEAVVALPEVNALAARTLSDRECRAFEFLPDEQRLVAFLRCWTAKEACLKALGCGLQLDPRRVETSNLEAGMKSVRVTADGPVPVSCWQVLTFQPAAGFVASLAWPERTPGEPPPVLIGFDTVLEAAAGGSRG